MKYFPALSSGLLVKRYKRFLADIESPAGEFMTIHCPNTGSMKNCTEPNSEVWYSTSANLKRKYAHTWELTRNAKGHYIGIHSAKANQIVLEAIQANKVPELQGYADTRTEVKYGNENSRIDLLLTGNRSKDAKDCYVEVKSVTLLEQSGRGYFPDAVSTRGTKHLRELIDVVANGDRAVLFFCVQHSGITSVEPAVHIDSEYASTIRMAVDAGVEVLAYKCRMSPKSISISKPVPFRLPDS